jgi:AAA+ ATPase superfamily predicted ATPase
MSNLIARHEECELLKAMLSSNQAEFLALYGRRRIGKTFLILSFFDKVKYPFFRVTGLKNGTMKEQIRSFTTAIGQTFYQGADLKEKHNWFDAIEVLHQAILMKVRPDENVVLFFDEFPWMVGRKSRLLETLEYYWNHYWSSDPRIKLIICGSSAAWIIRKIINQKGGLHNRITRKIQLKPFKLKEMKSFLGSKGLKLNHKQITEIYMATGGVPYYLASVIKGQTAMQLIDSLAFRQNGLLFNEFDNLFSSLFDDSQAYIDLLRIVSKNRYGLEQAELITKSKFSSGGTAIKKLDELVDTGFLMKFIPHFNKKKGIYYRLIDEYTYFYLSWIEPIKNTLLNESMDPGYWEHLRGTPAWNAWAGYTFESVCYQHLSEIRKALGLNPTAIPDTWRNSPKKKESITGAQIDLLFDRRDGAINLCEIKYTGQPFVLDKIEADNLRNKMDVFIKKTGTTKQIFLTLISAQGIKPSIYSEEMIAHVVTLDDLFK